MVGLVLLYMHVLIGACEYHVAIAALIIMLLILTKILMHVVSV